MSDTMFFLVDIRRCRTPCPLWSVWALLEEVRIFFTMIQIKKTETLIDFEEMMAKLIVYTLYTDAAMTMSLNPCNEPEISVKNNILLKP